MVWSKIDFDKEVRRQLIELRSLRKRVPEEEDIVERIERLEASHHSLLRKLHEFFRLVETAEPPRPPVGSARREPAGKDRQNGSIPLQEAGPLKNEEHLESAPAETVSASEAAPCESRAPAQAGTSEAKTSETNLSGIEGAKTPAPGAVSTLTAAQLTLGAKPGCGEGFPSFDDRCGACGHLLLTGVLTGETAVFQGAEWYHGSCVDLKVSNQAAAPLN